HTPTSEFLNTSLALQMPPRSCRLQIAAPEKKGKLPPAQSAERPPPRSQRMTTQFRRAAIRDQLPTSSVQASPPEQTEQREIRAQALYRNNSVLESAPCPAY